MSRIEEMLAELCPNGVPYRELNELGGFFGGLTGKSKADFAHGNALFIPYVNVYNNLSVDFDSLSPVMVKPGEKQNRVHKGDVLFTGSSETPNDCGMSCVVTEEPNGPLFLNSFCFGWRNNSAVELEPGYLKYVFRSQSARSQIVKTANGVTRFNISTLC